MKWSRGEYTGRSFWNEGKRSRKGLNMLRPFLSPEKKNSTKEAETYDVPYLEG